MRFLYTVPLGDICCILRNFSWLIVALWRHAFCLYIYLIIFQILYKITIHDIHNDDIRMYSACFKRKKADNKIIEMLWCVLTPMKQIIFDGMKKRGEWLTCFETGHPKRIGCLPPFSPFPKFFRLHPCVYVITCVFVYMYIYIYLHVKIYVYSFQRSFFEICFMHLSKRPYRRIKKRQYIKHRLNFTHNSIDYENAFEKETGRNNTFVSRFPQNIEKMCTW